MTVTPKHYRTKAMDGTAVQWDGTYPQAQSIVAWLKPHVEASYVPATDDDSFATIQIQSETETTVHADDWVFITVDTVQVYDSVTFLSWLSEVIAVHDFELEQIVRLTAPGDGEADVRGRVIAVNDPADWGDETTYDVAWDVPIDDTRTHHATELVAG